MARRIVLSTIGSFGDLHPFIATGLALKARGFEPVIAAYAEYREKVEAEGLDFHPVQPSIAQMLEATGLDEAGLVRQVAKASTVFIVEKAILPYLEQSFEDLTEAMRGADLVVGSSFAIVARLAAAKLGLPVVSLLLSPCVIFSYEDPPHLPEAPWLPGLRRVLGPRAVEAMVGLGFARLNRLTRPVAELRRRLGLAPLTGDEVIAGPLRADWIAAAYSPVLGPLPREAPPNCEIVGFGFYDSEQGGPPALSQGTAGFLDRGPAPLVFSLGSWNVRAAGHFYEDAAGTAARLGMRALLLVGRDEMARQGALASPDVFVAGYEPHSLIFPRAAAVIHHGGIGTVGQALRAGRPQLVCPMLGDQVDNAERLVRLGVARRLDHRRFSVGRATAALGDLLRDSAIAARAARIGQEVSAEDGPGVVAERIARLLA
jgi:UDP:flavonoid glycosyltransferase YjiC (YdhE family)